MTQKQKLTELRLAKAAAKTAKRQKSSPLDNPVCRGFLSTFRPDPVMQAGAIHWRPTGEELAGGNFDIREHNPIL